MSLTEVFAHAK